MPIVQTLFIIDFVKIISKGKCYFEMNDFNDQPDCLL